MAREAHTIAIDAGPAECFEALIDYESMEEWQSSVKRVEVLERDAEGRGATVAWELDAKVKRISYTLAYEYDPPSRIVVGFVEGDVKDLHGTYDFEGPAAGPTEVTFELDIEPGMWVPGPVKKILKNEVMARSLKDLKKRVESA
ncbi:MAG: SRPBCC family protein [Thermoleophilaceae bacterium]|nr:SRPBCC family protein [Thermoleophilaceae bacterium]